MNVYCCCLWLLLIFLVSVFLECVCACEHASVCVSRTVFEPSIPEKITIISPDRNVTGSVESAPLP